MKLHFLAETLLYLRQFFIFGSLCLNEIFALNRDESVRDHAQKLSRRFQDLYAEITVLLTDVSDLVNEIHCPVDHDEDDDE